MRMKANKLWQFKAKKFADYVRSGYNKDRHIVAILGSAGYTFIAEIKLLCNALKFIGEDE